MIKVNKSLKKIKCLVVEDFTNGEIKTIYDKRKFKEFIDNKEQFDVTKIFELNTETRNKLLNKLMEKSKINKDSKLETNITDMEMIRDILPIMTDIPYNTNTKKGLKELEEDLENPPEILLEIINVVSSMLIKILVGVVNNIKTVSEMPKEAQELLLKSNDLEILQEQANKEKEIKQNVKEVENIIYEIKETENKVIGE